MPLLPLCVCNGTQFRFSEKLGAVTSAAAEAVRTAGVLYRSGLIRPYLPDQLLGMGLSLARYGQTNGALYALGAARHPRRPAVIDERGSVSFGEMDDRTSNLAAAIAGLGLDDGDRVGLLCRNHRGFLESSVALSKLGADTIYLNTGLAGPQLAQVFGQEGGTAVIADEEFLPMLARLPEGITRIRAWHSGNGDLPHLDHLPHLDQLCDGRRRSAPQRRRAGEPIILTSGTTGQPKAAHRRRSVGVGSLVSILSSVPLRTGDVTYIAAPLFHAWGLFHFAVGGLLGSTLVLRRRFDAEATLQLIEEHRVTVLAAVPVMLQRIMELPEARRANYDTSSLRVLVVSGSALPGGLATRALDCFGEILYNLYGSTEVGWVSIAGPADLREAPGTAGRLPKGTVVRLLDDAGDEVPPGRPGRIFVGSSLVCSGYTGGASKPVVGGSTGTGDTGHFDQQGRLFVDGRDDDMIVSGGENVFPREVEDLLVGHPAVAEACVVGTPDAQWGQRLRAYVVVNPAASVTADELKAHVRGQLARYKVPKEVTFVAELPRNATGKIMRHDLQEGVTGTCPPTPTQPSQPTQPGSLRGEHPVVGQRPHREVPSCEDVGELW